MRVEQRVAVAAVAWLVVAGLTSGPVRFLALWIVACLAVVGIAIARRLPGLLGKRADGSIPAWSWVLFWPWHATTQVKARVHRRSLHPAVTEIRPGVFLGGWPAPGDAPEDCAIVDLTSELLGNVRDEAIDKLVLLF